MKEQIIDIVQAHWQDKASQLQQLVAERTRQIDQILKLENYYRDVRTDEDNLRQSVGGFGSGLMDMASLSSVLHQSYESRSLQKERYRTLQQIGQDLKHIGDGYRQTAPHCQFIELSKSREAVFEKYETHIAGFAKTFRLLRIAELEAKGRYDAQIHNPFFEAFNWRHLDNEEMTLCPPFVVFGENNGKQDASISDLLEITTSGRPLKVVVMVNGLHAERSEVGRAAALKSNADSTLLFLALRNVYFVQSAQSTDSEFQSELCKGMDSPRPGIFTILKDQSSGTNGDRFAAKALQSRAFPHLVYDPDRASDFVSCLDLSQNPAVEQLWPKRKLEYRNDSGEMEETELAYTFADFAAGEPEFQDQFSPLESGAEAIPIAEFLDLTPSERRGKTPVVDSLDQEHHLICRVPSQALVGQTADRAHLWHTLQELGGIKNPYVQAAEKRMAETVNAEKETALAKLRAQLDFEAQKQQESAVGAAMKNLALRLTGMAQLDANSIPLSRVDSPPETHPAPSAPAAPEAGEEEAEVAAQASDQPWIDEKQCTTCDDCTDLNKKIFAYNPDKKAYIKDPKGGPYRDIVKAAEKCATDAIHPGIPHDPNEKDLEKWIKRAEPYQ